MCEVLTGKEEMRSRKSGHLANYQMDRSLFPRQYPLSFLFHTEASEATGILSSEECCHVCKTEPWSNPHINFDSALRA